MKLILTDCLTSVLLSVKIDDWVGGAMKLEVGEHSTSKPQPKRCYTAEEYLDLERVSEERSEYLDGEIYAMAGESPQHFATSTNLVAELRNQLKGSPCQVFTKDMKVRSGPLPLRPRSTKGLFS